MESVDQQLQQLKERYAQMGEDELAALAQDAGDLTEVAQEALQAVAMEKGIDLRLKMDPLASLLRPEDEDLVIFRRPRSARDAGSIMEALTAAGIPSFLCLEVRAADQKRAHAALERADEEEIKEADPDDKDYAVLCPKCRSAKVVLKGRTSTLEASPLGVKYQWSCDACGHQWVDDGFVQEAAGGQSWPGEEFPAPSEEWDPK